MPCLRIDRHRNLEALLVPGRCRLAAALDPVLRRLDQVGGRHDGVDQLERLRAVELQLLALQHDHQRVGRLQHARQPLRAAGARETGRPGFPAGRAGSSDCRRRRDSGTTSVSSNAPPSARPLMAATHGLPLVSMRRKISDSRPGFLEQRLVGGFLALGLQEVGEDRTHRIQHRQVRAAGERLLAGGDDDALHALRRRSSR